MTKQDLERLTKLARESLSLDGLEGFYFAVEAIWPEVESLKAKLTYQDRLFAKSIVIPTEEYIQNVELRADLEVAIEALEFYAKCKEAILTDKTPEETEWSANVYGTQIRYQEFAGVKAQQALDEIRGTKKEIG